MSTINGSCLCGAVTYEIENNPLMVVACHCLSCQKSSSGGHTTTMALPEDSLRIWSGEFGCWEKTDEKGVHHKRYFCKICACRVHYTSSDMPGVVKLKTGTLDSANMIVPQVHFYVSRKPVWISLPEDAVQFDALPETQQELFDAIAAYKG